MEACSEDGVENKRKPYDLSNRVQQHLCRSMIGNCSFQSREPHRRSILVGLYDSYRLCDLGKNFRAKKTFFVEETGRCAKGINVGSIRLSMGPVFGNDSLNRRVADSRSIL